MAQFNQRARDRELQRLRWSMNKTARGTRGAMTQTVKSTISDADYHAPATITDSSTINFTITGQEISGSVIQSGLDHGSIGGLTDVADHPGYLLVDGTRAVAGNLLPDATDTRDLGSSTKLWRKGWLSELDAVVFAENTITLLGGWFWITKDQGTLGADVAAGDKTINFDKEMTPNDFVVMRITGAVEYIKVGTLVSGTTYNVTRNLDGTGANAWVKGTPFAVMGNTGDGRIELNAYDTPRLQILTQGDTYDAQTEVIRLGDLNGSYGISSALYGIGIGDYAGGNYLRYDPTNNFIMKMGSGGVQFDKSGISLIDGNSGAAAIVWRDASFTGQVVGQVYCYETGGSALANLIASPVTGSGGFAQVGILAGPVGGIKQSVVANSSTGVTIGNSGNTQISVSPTTGVKIISPEDISLKVQRSLVVGSSTIDETDGSIWFSGALNSYKNSVSYDVYGFHPLTSPLTSTSWDGDAFSTTSKTKIDLSAVFSAPAGINAAVISVGIKDSASATGDPYIILSPNNTAGQGESWRIKGFSNNTYYYTTMTVPCDGSGDIYYQLNATGDGTMSVILQIWGYWI